MAICIWIVIGPYHSKNTESLNLLFRDKRTWIDNSAIMRNDVPFGGKTPNGRCVHRTHVYNYALERPNFSLEGLGWAPKPLAVVAIVHHGKLLKGQVAGPPSRLWGGDCCSYLIYPLQRLWQSLGIVPKLRDRFVGGMPNNRVI